jgi:hypothetical protein
MNRLIFDIIIILIIVIIVIVISLKKGPRVITDSETTYQTNSIALLNTQHLIRLNQNVAYALTLPLFNDCIPGQEYRFVNTGTLDCSLVLTDPNTSAPPYYSGFWNNNKIQSNTMTCLQMKIGDSIVLQNIGLKPNMVSIWIIISSSSGMNITFSNV